MRRVLALTAAVVAGGTVPPSLAQTTHSVDVGPGFVFTPPDVTIDVGDTIRWTWMGGFHNVESGVGGNHDGNFRSGDPTSVDGTTFELTYDQAFLDAHSMPANTYPYYCIVHVDLNMHGTVTVIGAGDADRDGDVDLDDYAGFFECVSGPGLPFDADGETTLNVSVGPGNVFTPPDATIETGDTIHWVWAGGFHNVESGVGGIHDDNFRSGDPTSVDGTTFEVLFDEIFLQDHSIQDNLYPYFCIVHVGLGMTGTITVQPHPCATFDFDDDADVDLVDFGAFHRLFTGS